MANLTTKWFDGMINLVSRLGTGADKASHDIYIDRNMTRQEIDPAYRTSTWLRKIVDAPADDAVAEWRDWLGADKSQIETITKEENRLLVRLNIRNSLKMARKDGGSVIFMDLPGLPGTEVNLDTVGAGQLRFITTLSREQVNCGPRISNPLDPYYGSPEYYEINTGTSQMRVHPSRVVRQIGIERYDYFNNWDGWGDSVFVSIERALKNVESVANNTNLLVNEAKLDIISIPGLSQNIATAEFEAMLFKRFAVANSLKSNSNMILLDADETYTQKTQTFQGLPDVLEKFLGILSGASDIPATRLLGKSPDGMNATGASDMQNYHKKIRAMQELDITPALNRLDEALIRSALGSRPDDIWYQWAPLGSPSEAEQVAMQKVRAETLNLRINAGMPADILNTVEATAMVESGLYPGLDDQMAEFEKQLAEEVPEITDPENADIPTEEE